MSFNVVRETLSPSGVRVLLCLLLCFYGSRSLADVVVVVSRNSSVTSINREALNHIFLGTAYRLPDGEYSVPVDLAEGSGSRDEFYAQFLGKSAAQIKAHWSKLIFTGRGRPPREFKSNVELKGFLATHDDAIGYMERSHVDSRLSIVHVN